MNEVLRIELEAVRHEEDGVVRVNDESRIDAYAIYIVTDSGTEQPLIPGCRNSKMFLSRYVTEFTSLEDAQTAAVAMAMSIGVIVQNNMHVSRRYADPSVEFTYEQPKDDVPGFRVFFHENNGLDFDIDKYQASEHLKHRQKVRVMSRPGLGREMAMHILKDDTILTGNDKVCVMDGMSMRVFHYSPIVQVIENNRCHVLIDSHSREVVKNSPVAVPADTSTLKLLKAFAFSINA